MKKRLFGLVLLAGCGVPVAAEYHPPVPMPAFEVVVPATVSEAPKRGIPILVATTTTTTTVHALRMWDGELPEFYGAGTGCTRDEASIIAREMWDVGGGDEQIVWMLTMISRESTCDSAAHNGNRATGDDSYGLCQINRLAGWFRDGELLADVDPERFADDFSYNAVACVRLWVECGRGPWNYGGYYCRPEL